jgi:hypothetical protein
MINIFPSHKSTKMFRIPKNKSSLFFRAQMGTLTEIYMHKKIGKLYSRSSEREKERKIGKIKNV